VTEWYLDSKSPRFNIIRATDWLDGAVSKKCVSIPDIAHSLVERYLAR
jgi:hypothetical protein